MWEDMGFMDTYFGQEQWFKVCFFSLHKTLTDGLELGGLLVIYYDAFISYLDSFWWHPFTAEDPLVSKWCKATFLQLIYILDGWM